jgi:dihydropteroate synthase
VNPIGHSFSNFLNPDAASPEQPSSHVLARLLALGRPLVMGILNVTPDSFSDGGRFLTPQSATDHARRLVSEGADILDIGAESTRPYGGAVKVSPQEEWRRLKPMLAAVTALGIPVSIDTMKAKVAGDAIAAGVSIVNDVWGLQRDADMARVVAKHSVPIVVMHNRNAADPAIDIMADIAAFFTRSLQIAARAGITKDRIVLDPGIGFGKTPEQSMVAITRLAELKSFGMPLLVGASRKRFIDRVSPSAPDQRLGGSIASHLLAVENGAAIVRAHDVGETVQALRVAAAIRSAR